MRTLCRFQKQFLFLSGKKVYFVLCFDRTVKTHTVHRVLFDQFVDLRAFEQHTHCNICLLDRGVGITTDHAVQHCLTVYRLDFRQTQVTQNGFCVDLIPLSIVALGVLCQTC